MPCEQETLFRDTFRKKGGRTERQKPGSYRFALLLSKSVDLRLFEGEVLVGTMGLNDHR